MATLNGQPINTSYSGLIKTDDNGVVGATEKRLTDGQGNPLPMLAGTSGISFDGDVDFTGATVTGLSAGTSGTDGTSGTNGSAGSNGTSGTSGVNGIVSGKLFYFNQSQSSDIAPFKVLAEAPNGPEQTVEQIAITAGEARLVSSFLTPSLGFDLIPAGVQRFHMHFLKTAQIHDFEGYCTIELANSAGVGYGTILPSSNALVTWIDAATPVEIETDLILPSTSILPTDRMIVKVYAKNIGSGSRTITWYTEGIQNYSYVTTSIAAQSGTSGTSGSSGTSAAGGGGLVNGTGANSLKNSDALVTTPAQAGGNVGVALGNGAKANGNESVAIGDFAEALQTGCAAVGQYAEASATYASAWGRTSYARSDGSVAFGQQAGVPTGLPGAVAMGRQVVATDADTTHVRALKIVAPDGGLGGNGMTLLSPDGSTYEVTAADNGELLINGNPVNAPTNPGGVQRSHRFINALFGAEAWSTPYFLSGYGDAGYVNEANKLYITPFTAPYGATLKNLKIDINTGAEGALLNVALFKAVLVDGVLQPAFVQNIVTDYSVATAGIKQILTNGTIELPTDAADAYYFLVAQTSAVITFGAWNSVVNSGQVWADIYRLNVIIKANATFGIPTATITTANDGSTDGAIRYWLQYN